MQILAVAQDAETTTDPVTCPVCKVVSEHAESCPLAPCPYPECLGTADGASCRHPLPGDDDEES